MPAPEPKAAVGVAEWPDLQRRSFRAMGTHVELLGLGTPADVLIAGEMIIADLERHWSRFLPASDLSRLNAATGRPVILPEITFDIVVDALAWSRRTNGWFDPTVLTALEAAGYDRSFEQLDQTPVSRADGEPALAPAERSEPVPGIDGVVVHRTLRSVQLPPGVRLDLGGIGKGWAADLVAEHWAEHGHAGCASLGGDLRAVGQGPDGRWSVAVDDPFDPSRTVAVIGIVDGAVATSSTTRRTWTRGGARRHHLIDPHTGRPSHHPAGSVTVIAQTAVEAEIWAKAALLAGPEEGHDLLRDAGLPALLIDGSGVRPANGIESYLS